MDYNGDEMTSSSKRHPIAVALALITVACGSPVNTPVARHALCLPRQRRGMSRGVGTAPVGAVVSLLPKGGDEPLPPEPAVMDRVPRSDSSREYICPRRSTREVRNSEDMPHNVTVTRRGPGTTIFNVGTEPQRKYTHTFDRAGEYRCAV